MVTYNLKHIENEEEININDINKQITSIYDYKYHTCRKLDKYCSEILKREGN